MELRSNVSKEIAGKTIQCFNLFVYDDINQEVVNRTNDEIVPKKLTNSTEDGYVKNLTLDELDAFRERLYFLLL